MAAKEKGTRRGLQSQLNLIKIALIVIVCFGVYLFVMVHQVENPFNNGDLSTPIIHEPESRWDDTYDQPEDVGKRSEEVLDFVKNDDAFKDLIDVEVDDAPQNASSTDVPGSKFSKGPKSNDFNTVTYLKQQENMDSPRNVSSIQERNMTTIDSGKFSRNKHRSPVESKSDLEQYSETTKSSRRFDDRSPNLGIERLRYRLLHSQIGLRRKLERQFKSVKSSKHYTMDKNTKEEIFNMSASQSNHQQEKTYKVETSSQTEKLATRNDLSTNVSEKLSRGTPSILHRHNKSEKGNITKVTSLDMQQTLVKSSSSTSLFSSKIPVSNHQDKSTLRIVQNSSRLQNTTSNRQSSHHRQNSSKVATNRHSHKSRLKDGETKWTSDQLPKTVSVKKRRSLLIFGDDRSGTTFVTKMFATDRQMFTVYEPLWVTKKWFSGSITGSRMHVNVTLDVINALLSCHFTFSRAGKEFLFHTSSSWVGTGVFEKNIFRTSPFKRKTKTGKLFWPNLYRYPEFAENVCLKKFNYSVVKVGQVRVPRESISTIIPRVFHANPDTDIRVIQIVRDPRGSLNSRIKNGWISDFTYVGFHFLVRKMCHKIEANIQFGRESKSEWKDRYMEVTYREITTMPVTTAKKMYTFAGFDMPDSLIDWIIKSTNPDQEELKEALHNPYSHVRDSSKNDLKWRKESPIKRVRIIEEECEGLLNLLSLDPIADEMETLGS
ncbi:carbohydrate sulfotransferase 3-like [Stylophora pistillata]|uniref:carbohydrate sulfotransferase 3-like n=1 Tax=Stylophora pistillata TaxID=50429 RepID=UPI000C03CC2D|nr:carbohydrate sulfotransferase 3-like [Stylophora pistillata]